MPKSLLYCARGSAGSEPCAPSIAHAHELGTGEIAALLEMLPALLARASAGAPELRAVLVQRGGVVLAVRGRSAIDREGRASWIVFGRVRGAIDPRASWSARAIDERDAEALPLPPPPEADAAELAAFFSHARDGARLYAFDERAPRDASGGKPWIAGVIALSLILAMVAPWPESAQRSADPLERIRRSVREQRERLREELRFLDERGIWRFGRAGEPEVGDADAAGLQRIARALRQAVEVGGELALPEWRPSYWPRDATGRAIPASAVLLGSRENSETELAQVHAWLALFGDLFLLATAGS